MADNNVPPSIPPPGDSNHRAATHKRGCAARCCCRFLTVFWKILLTIVILLGFAILILYLIFLPQKFKIHVTNATLAEFNLANTTTAHPNIYYSLALDLAVRNPNKKFGVYFEEMDVRVYYEGHRFTAKYITNFFLKRKSGKNHKINLKGQSLFMLDASELKEFSKDKEAGVYKIDLKLQPNIRYKHAGFTFPNQYPNVNCGLKVPMNTSNGTISGVSFKTTKCDVKLKGILV